MKKLAILCLAIFMIAILVHPVNAAIVIFPEPDGETTILSDWTIDYKDTDIKDFENFRHINFGAANYLGVSISLSDKLVYDSYWNALEPSRYASYIKYEYNLYEFTKFVDMPVNIIHTRNLNPGDIAEFSIGNTASFTESRTDTVSVGVKYYTEFIRTFGFKLGISVPIEGINVGASQHDSTDIKVGLEFYRTIETVISSESNFSSIYSESFRWYNGTNTNQYYQLNYRQKFKIYFVAIYEHQYTMSE